MTNSTELLEALLSIVGVADAELEEPSEANPLGVRVRLAEDADSAAVAEAVRAVLASHGLRGRLATPAPSEQTVPLPPSSTPPDWIDRPWVIGGTGPLGAGTTARGVLQRVSVEEGRELVNVTVATSDGRHAVRSALPTDEGVQAAVVAAVGALFDPTLPTPVLVAVEEALLGGRPVITVVLDAEGGRLVGSATVGAHKAFALARAVWSALTEAHR